MYQNFIDHMREAFELSVPKLYVQPSIRNTPDYLKSFYKLVQLKLEKVKASRGRDDFFNYIKTAQKFRKKLLKYRRNEEVKLLESSGVSRFSKKAKYLLKPKNLKIPTLANAQGILSVTNAEKAELLAESFESQYVNPPLLNFELPSNFKSPQEIPWVTDAEMLSMMLKCKTSCSQTPDNVPYKFLKIIAHLISSPLAQLCNLSMMRCECPSLWKESIVIPLNKKENPTVPTDFRPISLTSQLCRIYERCLLKKILQHLDTIKFWNNDQHGFRPKKSTVTCMLEAVNDWTESIDEGAQVDVIYLDYAKAFDRVPHEILLEKLVEVNLNPNLIKWIRSYLSNRKFSVKVNNELSTQKHSQCGVPQGAVLSPILFGIFVNEIPSILPAGIRCKQFADDIKIYTTIPKSDTIEDHETLMQSAIDSVSTCRYVTNP
uniref:Reverse transcriptase domain-containing protein n=1 Tax=Caenorhabditis japonica TaxID=281687 RepID=A0A8R1IGV2_CAEJA